MGRRTLRPSNGFSVTAILPYPSPFCNICSIDICVPERGSRGKPPVCTVAALRFPALAGRQSRRCLETGSLNPPQAALRRFPQFVRQRRTKKFQSFSAGRVPAENTLTCAPWAHTPVTQRHWCGGIYCAAVSGFAALRMRRAPCGQRGERSPLFTPASRCPP